MNHRTHCGLLARRWGFYAMACGFVVAMGAGAGCATSGSAPAQVSSLMPVADANQGAADPNGVDMSAAGPEARQAFLDGLRLLPRDPAGALAQFGRAGKWSPKFYPALQNAAALEEMFGRFDAAGQLFEAVLAIKPDHEPALVGLAQAYQGMPNQGTRAEDLLRRHLDSQPRASAVRAALAQLLARQGRSTEAYQEAVAVLQQEERNAQAMFALGIAYRHQRKLDLATVALTQATDIDPSLGGAFNELGMVLLAQDEKPKAVVAFTRAAQASPHVAAILNNLGVLQTEVGAYKRAAEALQGACGMRPDRPEYQLNLGNALRGDQQVQAAEAAYQAALRAGSRDALYNLGVLYLDNDIPGKDAGTRYRESMAFLRSYRDQVPPGSPEDTQIQEFLVTAQKSSEQEQKRLAREQMRRQKDAAGAKQAQQSPAPQPQTVPPTPPATAPQATPNPPKRLTQGAQPEPTAATASQDGRPVVSGGRARHGGRGKKPAGAHRSAKSKRGKRRHR